MRALEFITGHVIYNPVYTYKFQLKTTLELGPIAQDQRTFFKAGILYKRPPDSDVIFEPNAVNISVTLYFVLHFELPKYNWHLIHGQALLLDSYVVKKFLRSVQHEAGT